MTTCGICQDYDISQNYCHDVKKHTFSFQKRYGFTTFLFNDEVIQGVTKKNQNCVAMCYNDIIMLLFSYF